VKAKTNLDGVFNLTVLTITKMINEKVVDVLNTLIVINNDRIEGYETASEETVEADLKTLFAGFIRTSKQCKLELISEVHKLGGTPDEGTRTTGKFFRMWMDVKAALTGNDRKAILNSCDYGEAVAHDTYKDAISSDNEGLTATQRLMLRAQQVSLKTDHNTVIGLRDALLLENA
jgi:uncharacterized protein (TIGR02284 family)